jgi:hypothetical protein
MTCLLPGAASSRQRCDLKPNGTIGLTFHVTGLGALAWRGIGVSTIPKWLLPERMQAGRDGVSLVVQVSLAALPGKARAVTSPANLSLCRRRAERPQHSTSGPQGLHCEIGC